LQKSLVVTLCAAAALHAAPRTGTGRGIVERVGDTAFLEVRADSFRDLTPREQALAYWLTQAAIAIDPIIYDQQSRYGLAEKRILDGIVAYPQGIAPTMFKKIDDYTKLFWANRGNHNEMTAQKFLPAFTYDELRAAGLQAIKNGAPIGTPEEFTLKLQQLRAAFFDPQFEPTMTAKSPRGGLDILQASANNFYQNVAMSDLKEFHESHPLNSRLLKRPDGKIEEQVYRAGTPDGKIPPGYYAEYLHKANDYLEKAAKLADPAEAKAIRALIRYYQTGDPKDWLAFGAAWVQSNPLVDFANGFIEVYRDARGAKGTAQAFVSVTDERVNALMVKVADHAQYFEQQAPWPAQYKNEHVKPPLAKAVETVIETGDFQVSTIGDNLPNESEIHEKYGTKSFMFTGTMRAFNAARGRVALKEFAASPEEFAICDKYGDEAEDLMTALHEVIGHGSGKLSPKLTHDYSYYLKEYASTLEEARADLMALWNIWDPKMREWGIVTSPEVAKAMYYNAARAPLTQLARIRKGDTIEEDHQRDRQMIVEYIMDKTGGNEKIQKNGKTYYAVTDFEKMRKGVGMLLGELMRIKAEGDYNAIKALVDKYGVRFDPKLRDQVVARYDKLNLPTYWAGINSVLTAATGPNGDITKVTISYPKDVNEQYLRYAAMYEPKLMPARTHIGDPAAP
jgi:dipeptidyl-peptidase-3